MHAHWYACRCAIALASSALQRVRLTAPVRTETLAQALHRYSQSSPSWPSVSTLDTVTPRDGSDESQMSAMPCRLVLPRCITTHLSTHLRLAPKQRWCSRPSRGTPPDRYGGVRVEMLHFPMRRQSVCEDTGKAGELRTIRRMPSLSYAYMKSV